MSFWNGCGNGMNLVNDCDDGMNFWNECDDSDANSVIANAIGNVRNHPYTIRKISNFNFFTGIAATNG